MFPAAVLTTHLAGLSAEAATPWCVAFVGFRALHAVFYLSDLDLFRSLSFLGGIVCIVALFVKAA